ncbi:MAG: ATP-binding cassette domain-containing protein [Clostridium argentinense]|uniref:ABC transporter ATP-binding protein n=1 Tax=Clostridium butanoliproducens TaxID=2991837 RepID=UPI001DDDA817|nr:ATP-binding cassette domain-containing protein [Clostridium butanoliproducens]MBS5822330.1 ATP-binding cassette domain-containing protein [Clostridium argentinense]MDU1348494.1 ATP-binding cassette domain-containing protein [Clostridium argentinense]
MLQINNLYKIFNNNTVNEKVLFNKFNLNVKKEDFITIIGSNGAGKSTLMNIISGAIPLDDGSIILNNKDISTMPEYKRSKVIGRVFQNPSSGVSPNMTILENMSMAYNKGNRFNLTNGVSKKNISFFQEMLSNLDLGLENKINIKVGLLSGGQRQALSLIMAVMSKPQILLLDEHTAALDPKTSEKINEITDQIIREHKITTLMVTHNLSHAISMGNRLIMMHQGNVVLDVCEDEKRELTVNKLLFHFDNLQGESLSDRALFG